MNTKNDGHVLIFSTTLTAATNKLFILVIYALYGNQNMYVTLNKKQHVSQRLIYVHCRSTTSSCMSWGRCFSACCSHVAARVFTSCERTRRYVPGFPSTPELLMYVLPYGTVALSSPTVRYGNCWNPLLCSSASYTYVCVVLLRRVNISVLTFCSPALAPSFRCQRRRNTSSSLLVLGIDSTSPLILKHAAVS